MAPTPAPKYHPPPVHPKLCHTPAPNAQPTLRVYNQSCRAKQSESTGKTAGASARPPFSAVGGPARAPKAQITCHIMRGLAQQALLLFLSLSLTHTHTDRRTRCGIIAEVLLCSVLFSSPVTTLTFASTAALRISVWPREMEATLAHVCACLCIDLALGSEIHARWMCVRCKSHRLFSFTASVAPK